MCEVEVRLRTWTFGDTLGELRKWLDHHNCIPESFDIETAADGSILVRIVFADYRLAEIFRRDFGEVRS